MFETAGSLTIVELVSSLVAMVVLPLLWAAVAAISAVRRTSGRFAVRIAITTAGGAFGLAVAHAVRAAQMPAGRVAHQHIAKLVRVGQLDVSIDLVCDPTAAAHALLVSFIAFVAVLHAVWTSRERIGARLGWIGLASSATLLVVLADGLPAFALGLQMATLAGWALAGGGRARPLGLALAGDTAVVLAAWILFWSLGGTFGASGYSPDPHPRFALVALPDSPREDGKSSVALTTYDDALVTSDDGPPLPGEPIRSPFTLVLEPGSYSFRIQAGAATTDLLVTHVALAAGHAYVLSPYGPTTSLRNLGDQLAVPRPTPSGQSSMRAVLASRSMAGVHVTTVLGIIALLAALARLILLAMSERGSLAYALEAIPPVVLALHIAPLVEPGAASVLAVAPALAAVVIAASAASARTRNRVPRASLAALAALAVTAVFLGDSAAAVVLVVAGTLGAAAATAALDTRSDVRWLGVSCAVLAGVLPGAGVSPGVASALAATVAPAGAGRWASAGVAGLVFLAVVFLSLAVFRVYSATIGMPAPSVERAPAKAPRGLVIVLSVAALLGGAALGVGTSPFGGQTQPLARRIVGAAGGVDGAPRTAAVGLLLSVIAAGLGLVAARRATRTPELPRWVKALDAPAALAGRAAAAGSALLTFMVRSVVIMNEDVVDDATELLASGFALVGAGIRRADAVVARGMLARAIGRGRDELGRTGTDDPNRFERLRMGVVFGMVALLGLVVLSSVVLG